MTRMTDRRIAPVSASMLPVVQQMQEDTLRRMRSPERLPNDPRLRKLAMRAQLRIIDGLRDTLDPNEAA